jgi:hypothetical protein
MITETKQKDDELLKAIAEVNAIAPEAMIVPPVVKPPRDYKKLRATVLVIGRRLLVTATIIGTVVFGIVKLIQHDKKQFEYENRRSTEELSYKTTKLYNDSYSRSSYPDTMYILVSTLAHKCVVTGESWQLSKVGTSYGCKWR